MPKGAHLLMLPTNARSPFCPEVLALTLLLVLTTLVYWRGLGGPFVFDDYANIVANPGVQAEQGFWPAARLALVAGDAGPLKRPLSMLSFLLNFRATGLDPFWFKLTNLGIHLLNGVLVWWFTRGLLDLTAGGERAGIRAALALVTTGAWLLHPLQLTSVLYVVQRMTSLSTSFVLLGLIFYLNARRQHLAGRPAYGQLWVAVPGCLLLASLTKESGALLILFAFALEVSLLRFKVATPGRWGTLNQFYGLLLVLPLLAGAFYLLTHPIWFEQAALNRHFSVAERLLTQPRVLFLYVKILLLPVLSQLGLFYDDFPVSHDLLTPPATLAALLGLGALVVAALGLRKRLPWLTFGVCWFLAGHAMESSFIMLEMVHLHRNYLACLGPLLAIAVGLNARLTPTHPRLAGFAAGALLAGLALVSAVRADQWRDPLSLASYEVRHRPDSARANYEVGRLLSDAAIALNQPTLNEDSARYLWRAVALAPQDIGALIGLGMLAHGPFPPAVVTELTQRLSQRPLLTTETPYLKALITCLQTQRCAPSTAQVMGLFGVILNQPALTPGVKADVLAILGMYYAQQLGDIDACVRLMREAVELQPNTAYLRINLAQALLFIPDLVAAEAQLAAAERLDRLGVEAARLVRIRADIQTSRTLPSAAGNAPTPP